MILPEFSPMHSHSEQYLELTQLPQQSPPSKLQSPMLVSSLQMPFPTFAFVILLVRPVLHLHSEHNSLLTQGPQQSCPSKEQWRLLLKSWQKPSPISFGNWHSIFEGKQIFAYIEHPSLLIVIVSKGHLHHHKLHPIF